MTGPVGGAGVGPVTLAPTPGQTVGPFFHFGLIYPGCNELVRPGAPGAVRLHGRVLDGHGEPVPDAVIEIWQPDEDGSIVHAAGSLQRDGWTFTGWGRAQTDPDGHYWFSTLRPGAAGPAGVPFFAVTVFARGLLDRLFTRAYLPASAEKLAQEPLLAALPPQRRSTLVTTEDGGSLVFDIRLQGDPETVFLDFH